ncbi:AI-2E family transporter [Marinimicrobium sp. ABcell2]|uniref:AI-2E family transporter n=1 Tax=Marinimicrobium sp. ABcell2 TaxID=3069751 RepID=UPI0027B52CDF|nr:AI-2E family transporter [Marinimicrobium sp. ABcell2]MDQ2075175.1 AI-2E family transporter [Marinimicrobium sp. ABcell2]
MDLQEQNSFFTPVQRRLIRFTTVVFFSVLLAALVATIIWVIGRTFAFFYNLIFPLAIAGILALILNPVMVFLQRRLHFSRLAAAITLLAGFFILFSALLFGTLPIVIQQGRDLVERAPDIIASWYTRLELYFPGLVTMLSEQMDDGVLEDLMPEFEAPGETFMSYIGLLVGAAFIPLWLFFALLSGDGLKAQAEEVLSIFSETTEKKLLYFIQVFLGYVTAFFRGQLVIALIMGALYAIGFSIIGIKAALLIGPILGLLNIIPYLGTVIGLLIVLPTAYLQPEGSWQLVALALVVFVTVQTIESGFLTPKIMAHHSGLHPALVVISLFFWGITFGGIIGMLLAVPLTAFIIAVWGEIKTSLSRSLETEDSESPGGSD